MEDYKFIFYILAAVAYLLYTTWRKAFKEADEATPPDNVPQRNPQEQNRPGQRPQQPVQPRTSFEDILRELQPKMERAKEQGREVYEQTTETFKPQPAPEIVTYDKMQPRVLSWEKPAEAREAAKRSWDLENKLNEAKAARKTTVKQHKYAEMLRSPGGVRDAVVLAEIFKRKYE